MKSIVPQNIVALFLLPSLLGSVLAAPLEQRNTAALLSCFQQQDCAQKDDGKLSEETPPVAKHKSKLAKRDDKIRQRLHLMYITTGNA